MTKILEIKRTDKKGIFEYHARMKAVRSGGGAGITLPKQLLGKIVEVTYKRKGEKNDKPKTK